MLNVARLNTNLREITWRVIAVTILPLGVASGLAGLLFGAGASLQTLRWPDGYMGPHWAQGNNDAPIPPGFFLPAQFGSVGLLLASLVYLGLVFVPMIRSTERDQISNPWPTWRYLIAVTGATVLFWYWGATALSLYARFFD